MGILKLVVKMRHTRSFSSSMQHGRVNSELQGCEEIKEEVSVNVCARDGSPESLDERIGKL